jgi:protein-L-isoaspartate(D-aspartate) O-methyltransferase
MDNVIKARTNMVLSQIITTTFADQQLLDTMLKVPRQFFVPASLKAIAYSDEHLSLGNNRYIMAPATLAKMMQLTQVTESDTVLDIGVTTGYSSAIFSKLADKVIAMESDQELASRANFILHSIGIKNTIVLSTNLIDGHPDGGPYNVIFFNGAVETIPESLTNQLADGGRLVTVTYSTPAYNPLNYKILGMLTVIERSGDHLLKKEIMPITLFPLNEFRVALVNSYH